MLHAAAENGRDLGPPSAKIVICGKTPARMFISMLQRAIPALQ
jgi:hypothetical protein